MIVYSHHGEILSLFCLRIPIRKSNGFLKDNLKQFIKVFLCKMCPKLITPRKPLPERTCHTGKGNGPLSPLLFSKLQGFHFESLESVGEPTLSTSPFNRHSSN